MVHTKAETLGDVIKAARQRSGLTIAYKNRHTFLNL